MKVLVLVAFLAVASAGCLVPSLSALDTRLASVGVDPTPFSWTVKAQMRIVDDEKDKKSFVWVSDSWPISSDARAETSPYGGVLTAVRMPFESHFFIKGVPKQYNAAVMAALRSLGALDAVPADDNNKKYDVPAYIHFLDCSQNDRSGWGTMACDIEMGPEGDTLLTLSKGTVTKSVLNGLVISRDAATAIQSGLSFSILCDNEEKANNGSSEVEESNADGKSATNAFSVVLSLSRNAELEEEEEEGEGVNNKEQINDQTIELVFQFSRNDNSAAAAGDAPTTVVGADGSLVYLLRGNTWLSRWGMPVAYAIGLLLVLPPLARWATKALTEKAAPVVPNVKDNAVAAPARKGNK